MKFAPKISTAWLLPALAWFGVKVMIRSVLSPSQYGACPADAVAGRMSRTNTTVVPASVSAAPTDRAQPQQRRRSETFLTATLVLLSYWALPRAPVGRIDRPA